MSYDDIIQRPPAVQQRQQQDPGQAMVLSRQQQQMERYQDARDIDPWGSRSSGGLPERVVEKIFFPGIKKPEDLLNIETMKLALIDSFGRIPSANTEKVRSLLRDYGDFNELAELRCCQEMALSIGNELLAETRLLCSDNSNEGRGLTAVGSVITNVNRSEQTVKMPVEEQPKRKIFGIFG